jgi:hypothetical protein
MDSESHRQVCGFEDLNLDTTGLTPRRVDNAKQLITKESFLPLYRLEDGDEVKGHKPGRSVNVYSIFEKPNEIFDLRLKTCRGCGEY